MRCGGKITKKWSMTKSYKRSSEILADRLDMKLFWQVMENEKFWDEVQEFCQKCVPLPEGLDSLV